MSRRARDFLMLGLGFLLQPIGCTILAYFLGRSYIDSTQRR